MYRRSLEPDRGMIFVFPASEEHTFWMHNTLIALDMIFLDEGRAVIGVVANAAPQTDTPRTVGRPSRYVVEVAAGDAAVHAVGPGTRAGFIGVPEGSTPQQPAGDFGAEALFHHPFDHALELAAARLVGEDEADPHPGLRAALLRGLRGEDPHHLSLEHQRDRQRRQRERELASAAHLQRTRGLDEGATLGDVPRIVGEERVHLLVVDAQAHWRALALTQIFRRRHRGSV